MPTASQRAMEVARSNEFQGRVQLALMKTALVAIDDENSARAKDARRVLNNQVNLFMASVAVVANASIGAKIAAEGPQTDTFGVADADIGYVVAEEEDPSRGVFQKLAQANPQGG